MYRGFPIFFAKSIAKKRDHAVWCGAPPPGDRAGLPGGADSGDKVVALWYFDSEFEVMNVRFVVRMRIGSAYAL